MEYLREHAESIGFIQNRIVCAYSTLGLAGLPGNTFNVSSAPAEDHVSIVTDLVLERVEMYAATGSMVMRVSAPSGPIMLPKLPDGIYWLRVIGGDAQLIDIKLIMKK